MSSNSDFRPSTDQLAPQCTDFVDQLQHAFAALDLCDTLSKTLDDETFGQFRASQLQRRAAYERCVGANPDKAVFWMSPPTKGAGKQASEALEIISAITKLDQIASAAVLQTQIQNWGKQAIAAQNNDALLDQQWWNVELPLTLGFFLTDCPPADTLVELAMEKLVALFDQWLDTDGWPSHHVLPDFGPLAASWLRVFRMIDELGAPFSGQVIDQQQRSADAAVREAFAGLPRHLLRLLRKDRTLMMSRHPVPVPQTMIAAMMAGQGGADDEAIVERASKNPIQPRPNLVAIDRSRNAVSEWGNSLIFHDGWERKACKLAASFETGHCQMEISKSIPLIIGNTLPMICLDGVPLAATAPPEVLVSQCDDQIAFAEVQWTLDQQTILQRQIILSLEDRCAFIGDAVVATDAQKIDYECTWPLAQGITTIRETETTEGYLYDGRKIRGLIIPPALPEWRTAQSAGKLNLEKKHFSISQSAEARAMHVPLFIDLDPKRSKLKRTWRQLTVAEKLEIVPADVAVAYRIQVNKKQFVFYRSLSPPSNRTFFGQNVNKELFLGRLEKKGVMTELLQVE